MFSSKILNNDNNFLQYDTAYERLFKSKLKKAEQDIKNGNVITLEELKCHIDGLEEKYAARNI